MTEMDFIEFRESLKNLARFFRFEELYDDIQLDFFRLMQKYSLKECLDAFTYSKTTEEFFPKPHVFIKFITQQRLEKTFKQVTSACPHCHGTGFVIIQQESPAGTGKIHDAAKKCEHRFNTRST